MVNRQFLVIFLFVTIAFSFFAYQPIDVVIAGPQMTDLEKFELELKNIEDSTGIKIKYETFSDIETFLIENENANVFIRLQLNDKSLFPIFEDDLVKYRDLYPAVNVEQELRNMVGWIDGNPTKRKTKTGIKKFVNSWLSKEQDQGGRRSPGVAKRAGNQLLKEYAR